MRWLTALKTWEVWTKAAELRLSNKLQGIFDDAMRQSVAELQKLGHVPAGDAARAKIINEFKKAEQPFKATMADHAVESANIGRKQTYEDLARQGMALTFNEFNPTVEQMLRDHSFQASTTTLQRMTGDVMNNLTESYRQGLGIKETAARLQTEFQNMRDWELNRIARTETNCFASAGAHQTMVEHKIQYEQWWTASDDRVRDQHIWLHGQITKVGDAFSNGLAHPGDRRGLIEEWINCRCRPVPFIMPHGYMAPLGRTYFYEDEIVLTAEDDGEDLLKAERLDDLKAELAKLTTDEKVEKVDKYFTQVADSLRRKGFTNKQVATKMMDYNYANQQTAWMKSAEAWVASAPNEMFGTGGVQAGQREMIKGSLKGQLNKGTKWISQKVHPDVVKYGDSPALQLHPKMRPDGYAHRASYNSNAKVINWSGEGGSRTFIHEYGHHLQDQNPKNVNVISRYFQTQIEGEDIKRIYAGMEEWGFRDKFYDLYSGKVYSHNLVGDEILSRGLEEMSVNPARFLEKAPGHFNIVYAVMRGLFI